jgi:hypothetical protein
MSLRVILTALKPKDLLKRGGKLIAHKEDFQAGRYPSQQKQPSAAISMKGTLPKYFLRDLRFSGKARTTLLPRYRPCEEACSGRRAHVSR